MTDTFEELMQTIERNAVDGVFIINNVEVFINSWRTEKKLNEHKPKCHDPVGEYCVKIHGGTCMGCKYWY